MLRFAAHYYAAHSSRRHRVEVVLDDSGQLRVWGAEIDVGCAAADVRVAPRVLGDTLRGFVLPGGAKCEALDQAAVELLEQATGRPNRLFRVYRWEASWPAALLAGLLVVGCLVAAYVWAIPALSRRIARTSPALAQKIGGGTLGLLDLMFEPSRADVAQRERLEGAFRAFSLRYPWLRLELTFRRAGVANAFALPDGTVVLTDELLALATHDDQLFGVMLHEIGHVVHGHSLRRVLESSALGVLVMVYWGDADQVTTLAAGLPAMYAESRYSQAEEDEADGVALVGMRRHGLALHHYADILRALEKSSGSADDVEKRYFSSHPATHERAERFERAERDPLRE